MDEVKAFYIKQLKELGCEAPGCKHKAVDGSFCALHWAEIDHSQADWERWKDDSEAWDEADREAKDV